ncbi:hypothetical protein O0I10_007575 [Lichtheimia ornata]|uniref:Uncharacterized protein n=1 Tax=Lichtheimia ornata TaxID=688661 RepID=A0AAD7V135_9FUNG|nr:uncharacterized protein O0I10_007575 [Lichtheimia ornata]KAJ8656728.1 hypothetical protein O0I10_007575 [Lichtheimia ornata]
MPKCRKGKGILANVKPQGNATGDEVLVSWLKEPGNYTRFIKANGRNVKNGDAVESKTDVCKDIAALYHEAGFIGCKPSMVFYKLNTWESKHVTAHLLARDGANEAVIRKAFPYYYDLVDVFDVSATSDSFANQRRQQKQQQPPTSHRQNILLRLPRGRKPMVVSSSSSSMFTTNNNRSSPVPQALPPTIKYNASVRQPPVSPLPNNATMSESSTTIASDDGTIQRMLNIIEEQQQRHNEQIDRMFEMYQQQQSTSHQILNTQLKLSLISQFREIGMTKDEIVEQLRSGH